MARSVLVLSVVVCAVAPVARGATDLFGFTVSNTRTVFDGTTLTTTDDVATSTFHLYRDDLVQAANLFGGLDGFKLTMAISDITASSALGAGEFTFKDSGTDTITGHVSGTWGLQADGTAKFTGSLSDVYYNGSDGQFDGWLLTGVPPVANPSSVSMLFSAPEPWDGGLTQITVSGVWFTGEFNQTGGSVDAAANGHGSHVPAPGAVVLALLGLMQVAGLRRGRSL